jgi:hypothetical protein
MNKAASVFISFVIGKLVSVGDLWGALLALIAVFIICTLITLLVPEQPSQEPASSLDWKPFLRLILMTGVFTLIILGAGAAVNTAMRVHTHLSPMVATAFTGLVGIAGMGVAVVLGVWVSIRISIGPELRQHPSFTWWVMNRLAFLLPGINLSAFMVFFLQEKYTDFQGKRAAGPAATAIMLVGISILLTALPGGWLADRLGRKPMIAISGVLAALATFAVIYIPHLFTIYVGAGLAGAATGLFYSANWALGTDIVPKDQAGRYLGLSNLAGAGAGAIGAYIGGPIADQAGYGLLFTIYGLLFLLSIAALVGIPEDRTTEDSTSMAGLKRLLKPES